MYVDTKREGEVQQEPSVIEKWVRALRSGKYRQGRLHLRHRGAYCCLGVLCLVAGIPLTKNGHACGPEKNGNNQDYHPISKIIGRHNSRELMSKNDSGESFAEIADWIEREISHTRR